jgi:cytochrome o ubiquinol oxidase subunit II
MLGINIINQLHERFNLKIMNKFKSFFGIAFILSIIIMLTGCNTPIVLDPKGSIGMQEKDLVIDALLLMSIVVVPVIFTTLFFAWKYRASNTSAKYKPEWCHSNALEALVWGIPIIIILVLGTITWRTTHSLDPYKPLNSTKEPIEIQVIALDWKWLFIYPKQNIATVNFVEFPIDTPVSFRITADAPMNGFQIPQLGTQIYAMAGMQTRLHLIANEAGDYFGGGVNFSGRGFSDMKFVARATTDESFNQWVQSVKNSGGDLSVAEYNNLVEPSENNPVTTYSTVQDNLFDNIIMKFMKPGMMDLNASHGKMKM